VLGAGLDWCKSLELDIKAVASLPDVVGEEDKLDLGWDYMTHD